MSAVGIVPARFASSRFPGKPLARVGGVPMVVRVAEGARRARTLDEVLVATDDPRIAEACRAHGVPVRMTSSAHATGTDRLAEAAQGLRCDVVVNVQGDEPLIEGFVIDAAVEALRGAPEADMATVVHALAPEDRDDPNRVKALVDDRGFAIGFSRRAPDAPEPPPAVRIYQHVGLYAYRRDFLQRFVALPASTGERAEALEQLRALDHGHRIAAAVIEGWRSVPVDVPEDVAEVERALAERAAGAAAPAPRP